MKEGAKLNILETKEFKLSYIRKVGEFQNNKTENELVFFLPIGCFWARTLDGCYHCGNQEIIDDINKRYYYNLIEVVKNEYRKYLNIDIKRVFFYVGGSFFEIKDCLQNEILGFISEQEKIRDIYIESRPEFITKDNIKRLKSILQDKNLIVAIGLESHSEKIRNKILNKGISNDSFEFAMEVLQKENIKSLVYILVKPPIKNISDNMAYEEAMKSINFAIEKGAKYVELKCGCVIPNTKTHELYKKGLYVPLNLWTVNKLLVDSSRKYKDTPIRLAYLDDFFVSINIPKGCILCNDFLKEKLQLYRENMNWKLLTEYTMCCCAKVKK